MKLVVGIVILFLIKGGIDALEIREQITSWREIFYLDTDTNDVNWEESGQTQPHFYLRGSAEVMTITTTTTTTDVLTPNVMTSFSSILIMNNENIDEEFEQEGSTLSFFPSTFILNIKEQQLNTFEDDCAYDILALNCEEFQGEVVECLKARKDHLISSNCRLWIDLSSNIVVFPLLIIGRRPSVMLAMGFFGTVLLVITLTAILRRTRRCCRCKRNKRKQPKVFQNQSEFSEPLLTASMADYSKLDDNSDPGKA